MTRICTTNPNKNLREVREGWYETSPVWNEGKVNVSANQLESLGR